MSDSLDLERFRQLADSYGGNIERWPETVRPAARVTARTLEGKILIEDATKLDALLTSWAVPAMPIGLQWQAGQNGLATAQQFMRKVRIWWASIGIAAALSGAATGTVVAALLGQPPQTYSSTIFGDLDDGEN